jgi:hypothetical protein
MSAAKTSAMDHLAGLRHLADDMAATAAKVSAMDDALRAQREVLFQAMGIVRLASSAAMEMTGGDKTSTDIWTALNGAYALLGTVADHMISARAMLGMPGEVFRGDC